MDCSQTHGALINHQPPLLFNLDDDVAEQVPLNVDEVEFGEILHKIETLLEEKNKNIENDMKSKFDDRIDHNVMPCCNKENRHCRCNTID